MPKITIFPLFSCKIVLFSKILFIFLNRNEKGLGMRIKLTLIGAAFAVLFWACGDGTIATKSGDDEMALLNYGEFNPDGMKGLVNEAVKACQEDPACAEAMERNGGVLPEESSSSTDSTGTDSLSTNSSASDSTSAKTGSSSSGTTSGSSGAASSSGAVSGSSGSIGSSSSATTVSSSSAPPATNIAGTCGAGSQYIFGNPEIGEVLTYTFTNSTPNLTPETYDWTFDEGSSILVSTVAAPQVSFSTPGTHTVKLVVNKGKDSESKEITCSSVKVVGTKVKNCECTTTTTSPISVSAGNPQEVTWTVSGCSTDGGNLTYTWETGVTANGTSATKSISTGGSHAPKVTVANEQEMDTVVTCQAVTAEAPPSATCNLGKGQWGDASSTSYSTIPGGTFYFRPRNAEGFSGTKSMTVSYGGTSSPITVSAGDGNAGSAMTAPSQEGTYPVTLSYDGTELCSATLTVAYPKITTSCSLNKSTGGFSLGSFSGWDPNAIGQNISVTMYRNSDVVAENLTINAYYNASPWKTVTLPKTVGNYTYRLDYHGNTVCSVPYNVELQKPACYVGANTSVGSSSSYTAIPGQTFYFMPGNSNIPSAKDMSLSFNNGTQTINVKPTSNSSTQLEAPAAFGTYPITLSDNGQQMCTATLTVDYPRPSCNIGANSSPSSSSYTAIPGQTFYFKPGNSSFVGEFGMTYTFNGSTEDYTLLPSNNEAIPLTAPEDLDTYPATYPVTLEYGNNQACSATLTVDYPKPECYVGKKSGAVSSSSINILPGQAAYFKPGNYSFTGSIGMTYSFNGNTENITLLPSSNETKQLTTPENPGEYPVTLSYGDNQVCEASVTVEDPADYEEMTKAAGTYSGPQKIRFTDTKTCPVTGSANSWPDWILQGSYTVYYQKDGNISGQMYISIPSGQSLKITGSCY